MQTPGSGVWNLIGSAGQEAQLNWGEFSALWSSLVPWQWSMGNWDCPMWPLPSLVCSQSGPSFQHLPSELSATTHTHKKNSKAMVQAALLTIKRKDHIIAVINHWLRFIIAIIPSKFIVTAVNDQFIRALTILGNGLSRLMWVTTNFSRIIA